MTVFELYSLLLLGVGSDQMVEDGSVRFSLNAFPDHPELSMRVVNQINSSLRVPFLTGSVYH